MILNTGISLMSNYTTQSYPEFLPPENVAPDSKGKNAGVSDSLV